MTVITSDERRVQYVAEMGSDLGAQFHRLVNECAYLHLKWNEYVFLFGTTPERVEQLNASASRFFGLLEDVLWDDVLLHIARLMDNLKPAGKDTLTLRRLELLAEPAIRPIVADLTQQCLERCGFAVEHRRNRLAHANLALALGRASADPLPPASRAAVGEALRSIVDLLNAVEQHYRLTPFPYERTVNEPLGASRLLEVLRDGLDAEASRRRPR